MKILILILTLFLFVGCSEKNSTPEKVDSQKAEIKIEKAKKNLINPSGNTLQTRILTPDGYERPKIYENSLTYFLRNYEMKTDKSPVLLYNGNPKRNQNAHAAVFKLPIEDADLQQCADSVMRVFAEFYWHSGQHEKIKFHFTDGFLFEYSKWKQGYRISFVNNSPIYKKSSSFDDSYENFVRYMRMVFSYAGTLSMETFETIPISLSELTVGDVILKGGSPGHVVMVVDVCENTDGKKAFLLAQGYMPAQEFHILLNPLHENEVWYYEDDFSFPFSTPEYTFESEDMLKHITY